MIVAWHLYTRRNCGLCDEFVDALEAHPHAPEAVELRDVDSRAEWRARFGNDVPVLTDSGDRVICKHRFDAAGLAAAMSA